MGFLANRGDDACTAGGEAPAGQTRLQSLFISLGLLFLAVPNLLFIWGWCTPWFAVASTAVLLFAVGRAVALSFRGLPSAPCHLPSLRSTLLMGGGLFVALLLILFFILRLGVLGFVPSFIDMDIIRTALFCNLRDAAWPLILPDGREMTYYLAGALPSSLLARLLPESGQWTVVLWTSACLLLLLLLVSSALAPGRYSWGTRLMLVALFFACFCSPLISYNLGPRLLVPCLYHFTGIDLFPLCPVHRLSCSNMLNNGAVLYNSAPYALMVAAMLMVCRHRAATVLPVGLALLVPLSPFAGIALLPLVLVRWFTSVRREGLRIASLLADALLPALMAFISALYFTRGQGSSVATLTGLAWNWPEFYKYEAWLIAGWLLLVLPLFFVRLQHRAVFVTLLLCCLLLPFIFIGAQRFPGAGEHNELWLKSAPMYLMVLACYWLMNWRHLGWYKYLITATCAVMLVAQFVIYGNLFARQLNGYMEVNDLWNGHLCHDAPFIHRMIPPCKEPMVPGVLLREAGASEKTFPGNLLPKAPGCDYSRPPEGTEVRVIAPL